MTAGFASVEEGIDGLEIVVIDGFEAIDGQLQEMGGALEDGFQGLNDRFDDTEERFDDIDAGLSSVHRRIGENRRELASLSDTLTKVQIEVMDNQDALAEISAKVRVSFAPFLDRIIYTSVNYWNFHTASCKN
jgi:chromosome segregation ATPase